MKNHLKSCCAMIISFYCLSTYAQISVDTGKPGNTGVNTSQGVLTDTPTPNPDLVITKNIESKFLEEKTLAGLNILVKTTDGNVILEGTVDTKQQLNTAINLAKSVSGVKDIQSKLILKGT
ncbi:MAG: BON domain-containing protein [Gammaproteobacteria bacterium]|nr:BON domain-containing protein [Gammaproteobacteria bacterium]